MIRIIYESIIFENMDHRILWMVKFVSFLFIFQVIFLNRKLKKKNPELKILVFYKILSALLKRSVENNRRINQVISTKLRNLEVYFLNGIHFFKSH